jgi:candidapepsin
LRLIRVPLSEVILDLGFSPYFKNTCLLAIYPSSVVDGYTILGDTFLRSACVVYDLDNRQVAVAQAKFG